MDRDLSLYERLRVQAAQLFAMAGGAGRATEARVADLELLIREAQTREYRRAENSARDRACYRLGGAFEPIGALKLDDVQLTGFLALGTLGVLLLAKEAVSHPTLSVADLLAALFRSPAGRVIRAHGIRLRWEWLQQLYLEETERFEQSRKGRDPEARWRYEKVTVNQTYLVGQISHLLQIEPPMLRNRGAAFDWIKFNGGNPRFVDGPPSADIAAIEAAFR